MTDLLVRVVVLNQLFRGHAFKSKPDSLKALFFQLLKWHSLLWWSLIKHMCYYILTKNMKICRGSCRISFVFCCTLVDTFHLFCSVGQLQKWSFIKTALIDTWWEVPIFKFPGQCWLWNTGGFAAEVCWVAFRNRLVSWRSINLRRDFLPNEYSFNLMVSARAIKCKSKM